MWNIRKLILLYILCVVLHDETAARKARKPKRPKPEEEPTTPQPNIVTYSSFGFNDVGPTYDGFVPSSPDYASYLSGYNQETSTRLYAPAFPTANDNEAYNNLYGQQNMDIQSYGNDANSAQENEEMQYHQSFNYMNQFGNAESSYQGMSDVLTDKNSDDGNMPVYGAKLGSRNRNRLLGSLHNQTNYDSDIITLNNDDGSFNNRESNFGQHESKLSYSDSRSPDNYYNSYNYANSYSNNEETTTTTSNNNKGSLKYQKVIDFTKFKPTYPTELESKYNIATFNPLNVYDSISNANTNENKYHNNNNDNNWKSNEGEAVSSMKFQQSYDNEGADDSNARPISASLLDISINHVDQSNSKNAFKNTKIYSEYKDQFKNRPTYNFSTDYSSNWKAPWKNNDYSNSTSVRYDYTKIKPYSGYTDEVIASSNNVPDYANYRFPEHDYSNFKKFPSYKPQSDNNFKGIQSSKYSDDSDDYLNQYKNYLTTSPTTTNWLNYFKNSEIGTPNTKPKQKRPQYGEDGSARDEVVHIPKKPHKYRINKHSNKHKGKPSSESNRFKSEEDLLGLRNHDTANPPYLPSFKLNEDFEKEFQKYASENSYKKLAEKWRQSYLNSYQKYSNNKEFGDEYEGYASESRPMHVPVPKPYPIEIPHPVIVPVPQPYPVRVPVPKPVAVPVIREITVPIEKPVPYPVYKKVPYPVEKPVPVQVEKEVPVHVVKPYPVPIPHVRPVFHHSKHSHEDLDLEPDASMAEEEYSPSRPERPDRPDRPDRPERYGHGPKKVVRYMKKTRSSGNRSRRPSPSSHYERIRRRWPSRRPPTGFRREWALAKARRRRPYSSSSEHQYAPSFRYKSYEVVDDDDDDEERR